VEGEVGVEVHGWCPFGDDEFGVDLWMRYILSATVSEDVWTWRLIASRLF
jgi:hypothetical protein